jgi:hypothetical protein
MSLQTQSPEGLVAILAGVGAAVGIGQLLASGEKITGRLLAGRTITSAALGACATIPLAWMPTMPFAAQLGLACALVTLGVAGIEKIATRFMGSPKVE